MSSVYEAIPEWNNGQTKVEKVPPVNIFDNLNDEKIDELVRQIRDDTDLSDFFDYAERILELERRDAKSRNPETIIEDGAIPNRKIIKRFFDMLIEGSKKEKEMAGKILAIKANLN